MDSPPLPFFFPCANNGGHRWLLRVDTFDSNLWLETNGYPFSPCPSKLLKKEKQQLEMYAERD